MKKQDGILTSTKIELKKMYIITDYEPKRNLKQSEKNTVKASIVSRYTY